MKIKNAWICRVENNSIVPVFGDVIFSDGKIDRITESDFAGYDFKSVQEPGSIDAGGRVLTVPSVNFHDHFYSRLAKGISTGLPMNNFRDILENLWWKLDLVLDNEITRASAQMAAIESVKNGVTYIFDHHSSPKSAAGSLGVISETLKEFGLRGALCFEITDRNGENISGDGLKETDDFLESHRNDSEIRGLVGLHASFTLGDKSLEMAGSLVNKYGCGIHIHLCEDKIDPAESTARYNKTPAERLGKFGLLNQNSLLAHGIYLTQKDYKILEKYSPALVLNPGSNMNNGVGLPGFADIPHSVPLLCGTDGMHSNPEKSLKQVYLLSRHSGLSFEESFGIIRKIYFDQVKFIRRYFPDFPSLQIGDRADFIIRDYIPPSPFIEENFWGHFIYGITERPVHSVIQNGRVLVNNFKPAEDFERYTRNISEQWKKLFNKMRDK